MPGGMALGTRAENQGPGDGKACLEAKVGSGMKSQPQNWERMLGGRWSRGGPRDVVQSASPQALLTSCPVTPRGPRGDRVLSHVSGDDAQISHRENLSKTQAAPHPTLLLQEACRDYSQNTPCCVLHYGLAESLVGRRLEGLL